MKNMIVGILFFLFIVIRNGVLKEFCANLWQTILFILNAMKDIIIHIGITDKIIAGVFFVTILIFLAIAGVSVSKKKRNKIKSDIGTATDVVFNIIDLIKKKNKCK